MTTDLMPTQPAQPAASDTPDSRPPRMLVISTNLLPAEIVDSRRQRKIRRIVLTLLVIFVVWLGAWYGQARLAASAARTSLTASDNDLQRLQRQQNAYSEVVATQAESQLISTQLAAALAGDLQWSKLYTAFQSAAPAGVQLTAVFAEYKPATNGDNSATAPRPVPSGQKPVGMLSVTGSGTTKPIVAAYVDALAKVPGLANPLLSDLALLNGVLEFTVRLDITESALGGRYTSRSASPSAVK